jgi:hypothetical protein
MKKNSSENVLEIKGEGITSLVMTFLEIRYRFKQAYKHYKKTDFLYFHT